MGYEPTTFVILEQMSCQPDHQDSGRQFALKRSELVVMDGQMLVKHLFFLKPNSTFFANFQRSVFSTYAENNQPLKI